jgi:hypothetical protein
MVFDPSQKFPFLRVRQAGRRQAIIVLSKSVAKISRNHFDCGPIHSAAMDRHFCIAGKYTHSKVFVYHNSFLAYSQKMAGLRKAQLSYNAAVRGKLVAAIERH